MKELSIDIGMLCIALENHTHDTFFWLDMDTGEILMQHQDAEDYADISAKVSATPERYAKIAAIASFEGYRIMQEFIETLYEGRARDNLTRALKGPKPFRKFKDCLILYPKIRELWHAFHDESLTKCANTWCQEHGINPTWIRTETAESTPPPAAPETQA